MKIGVFVGSRPNFVKAAVLLKELEKMSDVEVLLINTGQHYDYKMAGIFFEELNIRVPDVNLDAAGDTHIQTIANIMRKIQENEQIQQCDEVIVFGDVNSTLSATLACSKLGLKIHHVESGLRSFDRRMPEEINRTIIDHLSDYLYTSEESGVINLIKEGIKEHKIHRAGNIMIDTLFSFKEKIEKSTIVDDLGFSEKRYLVCTIHRQENVDSKYNLALIVDLINHAAQKHPVVWPIHPRTKKMLEENQLRDKLVNVQLIEPMGYIEFIKLVSSSYGMVTDSGGVQEETTALNVPCLTFRDSTERPSTTKEGTNTLIDIHRNDAKAQIDTALDNPKHVSTQIPQWDGKTSERIAELIVKRRA